MSKMCSPQKFRNRIFRVLFLSYSRLPSRSVAQFKFFRWKVQFELEIKERERERERARAIKSYIKRYLILRETTTNSLPTNLPNFSTEWESPTTPLMDQARLPLPVAQPRTRVFLVLPWFRYWEFRNNFNRTLNFAGSPIANRSCLGDTFLRASCRVTLTPREYSRASEGNFERPKW